MRLDEYLEIVSQQIRYAKIRSTVTEELKNHILDQAEAYEQCGALPEEALERAVREMGDPVETGVSLDRIHRPQMSWGIVIGIGLISLLSIGLFYAVGIISPSASYYYPWNRQAIFILAGFLLMLLVYRMDYSLFGAALYSFRGDGYKVLLKITPLILIPCGLLWITPSIITAGILFVSLVCLFLFAVWKDWFQLSRKLILGTSICGLITMPFVFSGYIYFFEEDYNDTKIRREVCGFFSIYVTYSNSINCFYSQGNFNPQISLALSINFITRIISLCGISGHSIHPSSRAFLHARTSYS